MGIYIIKLPPMMFAAVLSLIMKKSCVVMMMGMAKHHSYNDDHRRNMMVVTRHDCLYYHVIEMDMRTSTFKTFSRESGQEGDRASANKKKSREQSKRKPHISHHSPL